MLSVEGLSKSFGGLAAVRDLGFEVAEGSVTAIIGPNGAGKSTVFNLISGAIRPDAGTIRFNGADITGLAAYKVAARGIARSFQITSVFPGFSVRLNLTLARLSLEARSRFLRRLVDFPEVDAKVDQLLVTYGLAEHANDFARNLSHGDQRRLEAAICMAVEPRLLLLDEPTQGMGPAETADFKELIARVRGNTTVLIVEHDVDLVMGISDHVIVLQQGAKIAEGSPASVSADSVVREAYLGGAV